MSLAAATSAAEMAAMDGGIGGGDGAARSKRRFVSWR
jgi:hypothetical protein